ncbi:MAG: helix-turn-helix transcriptional regulator [Staphylococcus epidermidis]|nr:helix-turn-helix transcriptional regulator [Staphylococcus epidermidis]
MDRQSFTDLIQTKFKMVRIEAGYTQDTMAQTIGLSKKTLVQIEKERVLPNWTTCVSICALFRDSENHSTTSDIYWNTIDTRNGFILQSNKVSNIYRVLNNEKQPIFGTSKMREAETYFNRNAKEELIHV